MMIYCLNLTLMYRLKEGTFSRDLEVTPLLDVFFPLGINEMVLWIVGHFQVLQQLDLKGIG